MNCQILGRVVEVVSGQEYQAYVRTNILEPVGMDHSFVADGEVHAATATGHRPWFGTKRPMAEHATDRGTAPQGGIVASANDVARSLLMMMNGEDDVLSAEGKASMMRPAGAASPSYGLPCTGRRASPAGRTGLRRRRCARHTRSPRARADLPLGLGAAEADRVDG